jgi:hypothetical protein
MVWKQIFCSTSYSCWSFALSLILRIWLYDLYYVRRRYALNSFKRLDAHGKMSLPCTNSPSSSNFCLQYTRLQYNAAMYAANSTVAESSEKAWRRLPEPTNLRLISLVGVCCSVLASCCFVFYWTVCGCFCRWWRYISCIKKDLG